MDEQASKAADEAGLNLLWGAKAIGEEIDRNPRQVFYLLESGAIPARKIGKIWVADRQQLRKLFLGEAV